jgi:hypothetical protein
MTSRRRFFRKNGISLVEEICAVAVFSIAVIALLGTVGFSRVTVIGGNAQKTADSVITILSSTVSPAEPDFSKLDAVDRSGMGGFSYTKGKECQFVYNSVTSADNIGGYSITVRVYYNNGKNYTQMKAYASNTGGAFDS